MLIDEKTKPLVEILKRIVASGYIKNAYPLSAIIVSEVGGGKTTQLKKILHDGILALSDATPYGIAKILPEIRAKDVKHIIIFDLVEPMSRSRSVVNSFIGFMNSLIEEGIFRISTGFIDIKEPLKVGLITTTTVKELEDKRRGWLGIGFISRMLPITFSYTSIDIIQILEDLANSRLEEIKPEKIKLKTKGIEENAAIFKRLIPYAQNIDRSSTEKPIPFRRLKQLEIFLMANALLNNRMTVTEADFKEFEKLGRWINFDFNPL